MNEVQEPVVEGRVARRRRRVREALIDSARRIMSEKGVETATMAEIAECADVGAGTIYNYFKSKDELAVAVLEDIMHALAIRVEDVTKNFSDPGQVYAYGIRTVLETATHDLRWKQLLSRSEVIADAIYRRMGPYAIRDIRQAHKAGRFPLGDGELIWKMATHAIVGVGLAITNGDEDESKIDDTVVLLLCMTGLGADAAKELASRPRPPLAPER